MKMLFFSASLLIGVCLQAQSAFSISKVVVFKNGTAFLHKEAVLDADSGIVDISPLPIAAQKVALGEEALRLNLNKNEPYPVLFGTFHWELPDNEVKEAVFLTEIKEEKRQLMSIEELIRLNADKQLCIWKNGAISSVCGRIINDVNGNTLSNYFLLKEGNAIHQIRVGEIARLEVMDGLQLESVSTTKVAKLQLKLEQARKSQKVGIAYLQKGITWLSNYQCVIRGNGQATLSLVANLLNDIESLDGVDVYFALGIPSFQFDHVSEPLFNHQSVGDFLSTLIKINKNSYPYMANAITTQRGALNQYQVQNAGEPALSGMDEDFFLYPYERIYLPKGSRGHYKLMETTIQYKDIYLAELGRVMVNNYRSQENEQENPVWHTLEFQNETNQPWTTGSITFYKEADNGMEPIGQSQLDFLPSGKKGSVKMNRVPDIWVSKQDREVSREQDVSGYADLVRLEGKVKVINYKRKAVTIKIEREIDGRLLKSSIKEWQTDESFNPSDDLNPISKATWTIQLEPGATQEIDYTYEMFVN